MTVTTGDTALPGDASSARSTSPGARRASLALGRWSAPGFGRSHITGVTAWMTFSVNTIVTAMVAASFGSYASATFTGDDPTWRKVFAVLVVLAMSGENIAGLTIVARAQTVVVDEAAAVVPRGARRSAHPDPRRGDEQDRSDPAPKVSHFSGMEMPLTVGRTIVRRVQDLELRRTRLGPTLPGPRGPSLPTWPQSCTCSDKSPGSVDLDRVPPAPDRREE